MRRGVEGGWFLREASSRLEPADRAEAYGPSAFPLCWVQVTRITRREVAVPSNILSVVIAVLVIIVLIFLILRFV